MTTEPEFLSFKGLKQYTPDAGWTMVPQPPRSAHAPPSPPLTLMEQLTPTPGMPLDTPPPTAQDIPTLTETPTLASRSCAEPVVALTDPLMTELFEQLQLGPADELTQTWRSIASGVHQLNQRMVLQRELQDRLEQLDREMADMRHNLQHQLQQAQQAARQQLSGARLRCEVSALALNKLSQRLSKI